MATCMALGRHCSHHVSPLKVLDGKDSSTDARTDHEGPLADSCDPLDWSHEIGASMGKALLHGRTATDRVGSLICIRPCFLSSGSLAVACVRQFPHSAGGNDAASDTATWRRHARGNLAPTVRLRSDLWPPAPVAADILELLSCARPLRAQATYFLLLLCLHECYPCLGRCRQHAQRALDTCSILAAKLLIANAEAGKFLSAACVGASTEQNIACAHAMIQLTFGLQLWRIWHQRVQTLHLKGSRWCQTCRCMVLQSCHSRGKARTFARQRCDDRATAVKRENHQRTPRDHGPTRHAAAARMGARDRSFRDGLGSKGRHLAMATADLLNTTPATPRRCALDRMRVFATCEWRATGTPHRATRSWTTARRSGPASLQFQSAFGVLLLAFLASGGPSVSKFSTACARRGADSEHMTPWRYRHSRVEGSHGHPHTFHSMHSVIARHQLQLLRHAVREIFVRLHERLARYMGTDSETN